MKKLLLAVAAVASVSLFAMSGTASADCGPRGMSYGGAGYGRGFGYGMPAYRGPVRGPVYGTGFYGPVYGPGMYYRGYPAYGYGGYPYTAGPGFGISTPSFGLFIR